MHVLCVSLSLSLSLSLCVCECECECVRAGYKLPVCAWWRTKGLSPHSPGVFGDCVGTFTMRSRHIGWAFRGRRLSGTKVQGGCPESRLGSKVTRPDFELLVFSSSFEAGPCTRTSPGQLHLGGRGIARGCAAVPTMRGALQTMCPVGVRPESRVRARNPNYA